MTNRAPTYQLGDDFDRKLTDFTAKFISDGFEEFSREFSRLDKFIAEAQLDESERTDKTLRQNEKEIYLLEAVSYKIFDQINRKRFNDAKETLIIIPDCLSMHNSDCLKTDEEWGDRCQQCVDECQANEVVELGEKYGLEVVFSKRKLTEQIEHYADKKGGLSLIGIGCLLMLARGMRTAAEVGIPTRGVLLSFTGCDHWNDEPFGSEFSLEQLRAILKEKYE
jgi:hypothetical protein